MTWLFTQVWLWSFAGFLCGVGLTWLLFVRPAHRQLRQLRERQRAAEWDATGPAERAEDDAFPREESDTAVWDLLDVDSADDAAFGGPTGDRPFRVSGTAERSVAGSSVEESSSEQSSAQPPDDGRGRWMEVAAGDFGGQAFAAEHTGAQPGRGEQELASTATEWQPVQETPGTADGPPVEDSELRLERDRETTPNLPRASVSREERADPPTAPAELAPGAELAGAGRENTWFAASEFDMYDTDSVEQSQPESPAVDAAPRWNESAPATGGAHDESTETLAAPEREESEGELTGRLRSLFEPLAAPGIEPDREGVELPVHTPAAEEETSSGEPERSAEQPPEHGSAEPAEGNAADSVGESGTAEETGAGEDLPRRVPGSTDRPGTPPNARPVMTGRVLDMPEDAAVAPTLGRPPNSEQTGEGNSTAGDRPQEWYPDEQLPDQERPDASYTVKGQFGSRQYHTPDSPYFDHVVAEVWFRSAADAEQAGFEPWDSHSE
ncbi:hypothetical protein [Actinopolyspora saharensis]|uniref:Uncharacterized protein n=1 Tax=Actinopolyspora saharensis TaxID=995062 RepID=A0A1H1GFV0_9ACTN|nr:hypothetical protein [Actinopolyspora saharensis]SDR11716.1 hypothetical protein SAMN04489718_3609 [Actinopolyspora saharensis]